MKMLTGARSWLVNRAPAFADGETPGLGRLSWAHHVADRDLASPAAAGSTPAAADAHGPRQMGQRGANRFQPSRRARPFNCAIWPLLSPNPFSKSIAGARAGELRRPIPRSSR